jgi:putative inorganic carbon (hco3(-)) transporter
MVTRPIQPVWLATASPRRPGHGWRSLTLTVVGPSVFAVVVGVFIVRDPLVTLAAAGALVAVGGLLLSVDLAALTFVALEPFEDYAKSLSGAAVKLFGALLLVAWLLRLLSGTRPARLRHPAVYAAAALMIIVLAATAAHPNGPLGSQVDVRYFSYLAAFIVLVDCMQGGLSPMLVARVYVLASTAAAACGVVAYLATNRLRVGGPVGDPNDFAFYLIAALPLALALRRRARWPWTYDVALAVLLLAIAGTVSRGALVGIAAMVAFAVATRQVRLRVALATAASAAVGVALVVTFLPNRVDASFHAKSQVAAQNANDRLQRWEIAAEMTADHPVLGLGPAGFRLNYNRYVDNQPLDPLHFLDVSHDTYLEVSSELGLLGLGAFLCLLTGGFLGARRYWLSPAPDATFGRAICTATVGVVAAAVFLTEQYFLPLWLLAALGAALDPKGKVSPSA